MKQHIPQQIRIVQSNVIIPEIYENIKWIIKLFVSKIILKMKSYDYNMSIL